MLIDEQQLRVAFAPVAALIPLYQILVLLLFYHDFHYFFKHLKVWRRPCPHPAPLSVVSAVCVRDLRVRVRVSGHLLVGSSFISTYAFPFYTPFRKF